MGSKQSTETNTQIINDSNVRIAMKNMNENVNNMTMEILQENLTKSAAGAAVTQTVSLRGAQVEGDLVVSGISQDSTVKINVSALANSDMKQELINETMNQMQSKLVETMKTSQDAADEKGEQVLSDLLGALSGAITAIVPGASSKSTSNTTLQNLMNIESDTELQNIIKQTVNSELVNRVVTEVASNVVGEQLVDLSEIDVSGSVVVSDISQKFLSEQIMESISDVGTGAEIMAGISSVNIAEVEKSLDSEQEAKKEEIGTFDALGGFAQDAIGAVTGLVGTGALTVILPVLIVGGILLVVFKPLITAVVGSKMGVDMNDISAANQMYAPPPQQFAQPMPEGVVYTGGSASMSLFDSLIRMVSDNIAMITGFITLYWKKVSTFSILATIIIGGLLTYLFYVRKRLDNKLREKYENLKNKLTDLHLMVGNKYIYENEEGEICMSDSERDALKFNVAILGQQEIYFISQNVRDNKYLMTDRESGSLKLGDYSYGNDTRYRFKMEKVSDDGFKLIQKNKYVGGTPCLKLMNEGLVFNTRS